MGAGAMYPWSTKSNGGITQTTLAELRSRARRLLEGQTYLEALEKSLNNRTCPPAIESLLYYYAYGKPAETLNVTTQSAKSIPELVEMAKQVKEALEEAEALEQAIDAMVIAPMGPTVQ